jgi:hypothetical protein
MTKSIIGVASISNLGPDGEGPNYMAYLSAALLDGGPKKKFMGPRLRFY